MRTLAFWFSLVFIFIIPWETAVKFEGLGTLIKLAGFALTGCWLAALTTSGKFRQLHPFHLVVFLFVLWNFISVLWSVDTNRTMDRVFTYTQLAIITLILWDLYTTPKHLKAGLQVFILGYFVTINAVISDWLNGESSAHGLTWQRYSAFTFNMNSLALMLALGIPIAWHLAISPSNGLKAQLLKVVNFAYVPLSLFSILLTSSRGGIIATTPAFFYILGSVTRLTLLRRVLLTTVLVGALYVLFPLVPQNSLDRIATTEAELTEGNLSNRKIIWEAGFPIFLEHPINGAGSGSFLATVKFKNRNVAAHNTYLTILVEVGLVGFALFAIILLMTLRHAIRQPKVYATMWTAVVLIWIIGVFSINWEIRKHTWLVFSLVLVSAGLYEQREETNEQLDLLSNPIGDKLRNFRNSQVHLLDQG